MKRILCVMIMGCFSIGISAQFIAGLKGHAANTWMLNKHISDAGDELDYKGSYAGGFAVHGIYLLSEQSGLGLNLGASTIKQQVQGDIGNETFVNEFSTKYTDIGLFYTYLSEGGLFIEVGPQFSLRGDDFEEIYDLGGDDQTTETIVDPNLNSSTIFGVFGIGGMINLNEELKLGVGLRFGYGLTDLTTELSEQEYFDLLEDDTSSYTLAAHEVEVDPNGVTIDYQPTNPAFASFNLGLYYTFGE